MFFRPLSIVAAALLAAPMTFAADGEGPGIAGGGDRPDRDERPDVKRPEGDRPDRPERPGPDGAPLFAKFDHDKSGDISEKEFLHGLRIMMEQRREGGDRRPPGGDRRPEGGDRRPEGGDRRPEGGDRRPEGGDRRPEGGDRRPEGGDRPGPNPEQMAKHAEMVFKKADADNSGGLNEEEFRNALGAIRSGKPGPNK